MSNLRQIAIATQLYLNDNSNLFFRVSNANAWHVTPRSRNLIQNTFLRGRGFTITF